MLHPRHRYVGAFHAPVNSMMRSAMVARRDVVVADREQAEPRRWVPSRRLVQICAWVIGSHGAAEWFAARLF